MWSSSLDSHDFRRAYTRGTKVVVYIALRPLPLRWILVDKALASLFMACYRRYVLLVFRCCATKWLKWASSLSWAHFSQALIVLPSLSMLMKWASSYSSNRYLEAQISWMSAFVWVKDWTNFLSTKAISLLNWSRYSNDTYCLNNMESTKWRRHVYDVCTHGCICECKDT